MTNELTSRYIELGLYQGQQLLLLDLEKCTRCDECVKACADSHEGVTRVVRDGPRFGHFLVAISCRSCHDPYCLNGCPVNAIHREGETLEIKIDDHCIGCGLCAHNCPYGSIHMVEELADGTIHELPPDRQPKPPQPGEAPTEWTEQRGPDGERIRAKLAAANCDLCAGSWTGPRCVYACPHDAAHRVNGEQALELANNRLSHKNDRSVWQTLTSWIRGNPAGE